MNKGYREIVATCELFDYREELAGKHSVWKEYWLDTDKTYIAMFTNYQTGELPHTIFTEFKDE
jgi:hypothetical protein